MVNRYTSVTKWSGLIYTIPLLEVAHFPSIQGGEVWSAISPPYDVFPEEGKVVNKFHTSGRSGQFPLLARGSENRLHISARSGPLPRGVIVCASFS